MTDNEDSTLLTPEEAASQLGVSPLTVRHWAQSTKLTFITTPDGHQRFTQQTIDQLKNKPEPDKPITIVIVDDDRVHAKLMWTYVEKFIKNVELAVAHDGFEAGHLINELKPDIVLLDLMMPGLDGFSVCKRIKNNPSSKHIRVISISGFTDDENINRILDAGAEVCLSKPIDKVEFENILNH